MTERTTQDVLSGLSRILTEAGRLTRPVLEQDVEATAAAGHPVWVESGRREPADFADLLAQALAAAAANLGSTRRLLAGRPGSWEADLVRQLVAGTVGWDDEHLAEHLSEEIVIRVDLDELLDSLEPAYDAARHALMSRLEALPTDAFGRVDDDAAQAIYDLETRLDNLQDTDRESYRAALTAAVERVAAGMGIRVPVSVTSTQDGSYQGHWYGIADQIVDAAIRAVALPGDGRDPLARLENPDAYDA